jgi:hypothetical protein
MDNLKNKSSQMSTNSTKGRSNLKNHTLIIKILFFLRRCLCWRWTFTKYMLTGVNIVESWLVKAPSVLGCSMGKVPFVYLGFQSTVTHGVCYFGILFWLALELDWLNGRVDFFSFSDRLIVLKSVLTFLHVYVIFFFNAPPGIISSIELLLNQFFR